MSKSSLGSWDWRVLQMQNAWIHFETPNDKPSPGEVSAPKPPSSHPFTYLALVKQVFSRRSHFTLQYLDSRWLSVVMSIDVTRAIFITLLHTFQINPAFCSKIPYIYRKYLLPSTKYPHTVCWGQSKQEWQNKSLFKLFDRNGGIFDLLHSQYITLYANMTHS